MFHLSYVLHRECALKHAEIIDFHFGIGWGAYNGSKYSFNNPLGYVDNRFKNRDERKGLGIRKR